MSGTFISQQQFDDIDACMLYIETLNSAVSGFNGAAEVGQKYGLTHPPTVEMREGETQARLWRLKTEPSFYRFIADHIDELAPFTEFLSAYIRGLSPVQRKGTVSSLSGLSFPPGLYPRSSAEPITDCLSLLQYHQKWVWAFSELFRIANSGYDAIREAIYRVLPRVFDFMAVHLQIAASKNLSPKRLSAARDHADTVRAHYWAGMGATANFLTQHRRIGALVAQANRRFDQLENIATLSRLDTDMKLTMVELKQAQRLSREIVALRTD